MSSPETKALDPLRWIQEQIRDHLIATPGFAGLNKNILIADQGSILETIDVAVGKIGLAIIIEPTLTHFHYSGNSIVLVFDDEHPLTITVFESVVTNRGPAGTRRRASEIAVAIVKAFRPGQTPSPPCVFTKAVLQADSQGKCVYTLSGVTRIALEQSV